jgi:hypothetical protein
MDYLEDIARVISHIRNKAQVMAYILASGQGESEPPLA